MALVLPTLPDIVAGQVVQASDLNAVGYAAQFMLNKPLSQARDNNATGTTITTSGIVINFTVSDYDSDGMWNSGTPDRLTVQTPGWYKVRYAVSLTSTSGKATNAYLTSTTGPNNPAGSGHPSAAFWGSYCDQYPGACQGRGIWPFYLYAGDYMRITVICSSTDTLTKTTNVDPNGSAGTGSILVMEYVGVTP